LDLKINLQVAGHRNLAWNHRYHAQFHQSLLRISFRCSCAVTTGCSHATSRVRMLSLVQSWGGQTTIRSPPAWPRRRWKQSCELDRSSGERRW